MKDKILSTEVTPHTDQCSFSEIIPNVINDPSEGFNDPTSADSESFVPYSEIQTISQFTTTQSSKIIECIISNFQSNFLLDSSFDMEKKNRNVRS